MNRQDARELIFIGREAVGNMSTQGILEGRVDVGFNTLLWNRTLLSISTQFGITGHTPDFRVITALPIRF